MHLYSALPKTPGPNECHSIMRKTVHEWLETNHNGLGMAKKRAGRRKTFIGRQTSISQVEHSLLKLRAREAEIRKRPK